MLFEAAIGDAYGVGFEFTDPGFVKLNNKLCYVQRPGKSMKPGSYSDDTQMSLALMEYILGEPHWTLEELAEAFTSAFHRDPRQGYSGGFYRFLLSHKTGKDFLRDIRPDSNKCGAAMRAWPLGLCSDMSQLKNLACLQASLTHNTYEGKVSSHASALMTHYFLYQCGDKKSLREYISGNTRHSWPKNHGPISAKGFSVVEAAITAVEESSTLSEVLCRSISFTGDVDSVATIAMAAASCSPEIKDDLPVELISGLEQTTYGAHHLAKIDLILDMKYSELNTGKVYERYTIEERKAAQ